MLSIMCLGSCKTHARGLVISWLTGDVKSLPDEVVDSIMNGPHKHSFRIVGGERDNLKVEDKITPLLPVEIGPDPLDVIEEDPVSTNVTDTLPSPSIEQNDSLESVNATDALPRPSDAIESTNLTDSLPSSSIELPLAKDASWITVKNYLIEMEGKGCLTADIVRKVQQAYPTYKSVQTECERLLNDLI